MARAWVYDRTKTAKHRAAATKAREAGRKPPARWAVMYYDRAGRLKSEVAANKAWAEMRRGELERALTIGIYSDPALAKATVNEIAEKWLDTRHDLRRSTWWKYRGILDNHVLPCWGDLPLSAVSGEDIAVWVSALLRAKNDGGSGLGASQTRHAYRVLTMVLEWCVPNRIPRNPARGVKLPVRPEQ